MATYPGVAIGINHYQFLPPLNYGQADAQALWNFLVQVGNLSSNQCLLLTDASSMVGESETCPTKENILFWLENIRQKASKSQSWHWFFFCGYGISWEQVDYLMPIDGNPTDIPGTAIPMREVFAALQASGSENILVLLDINRSSGSQFGEPVGAETVELAREMGIVLVLSSQLNEFSHEAAALGNGLFTVALLEALRYYHTDTTLEQLEYYLRDRLPQLSQHHWRPIQTPLFVIPQDDLRQQRILPTAQNLLENEKTVFGMPKTFIPMTPNTEDTQVDDSRNGTGVSVQKTATALVGTPQNTSLRSTTADSSHQLASRSMAMVHYPNRQTDTAQKRWWQRLLLWGGGAVMVLALLVAAPFLRNREALLTQQAMETPLPQGSPAIALPPNANDSPASPLQDRDQKTSLENRQKANQSALDQARLLIRGSQASLFSQAIVQARNVQPGDPLYEQAQQDIMRWSQVILDLAEGRAEQGNFGDAIATAQLVPSDNPAVYQKAQQRVEQWKMSSIQQQKNQEIIAEAETQIQINQASSYRRAINTLSKIPPDQPLSAEAQKLTTEWSRTIYLIAQSRASRGKFPEAIETAVLVPSGRPEFEAAQKAIARWKQGKR
ncbi:MAG: caspase family protein [Potamolinea sp.]